MNTIREHWKDYSRLTYPAKTLEPEKTAFYVGAMSAFDLILAASEQSEAVGALLLEGVYQECAEFIEQQKKASVSKGRRGRR